MLFIRLLIQNRKSRPGCGRRALITWALAVALLFCVSAGASLLDTTHQLRTKVSSILREKKPAVRKKRIREIFGQYFDYAAFESKVLVDKKTAFTKASRARFSRAFRELLIAHITQQLLHNAASLDPGAYAFTFDDNRNQVQISGKFETRDFKISLLFDTRRVHPRIIDVSVSRALLSRNYRAVINKMLRDHGVEYLIGQLKKKRDEL